MAGVKGKSGPPENDNAAIKADDKRHGFYSANMSAADAEVYDEAKTVSLLEEIALCRTKLRRLNEWAQEPDNEITDGTFHQMDRMLSRVGDLTTKVSIIERNAAESGQSNNDDFDRFVDVATRTGAHRTTFKPNGNGKANGKSNGS